MIFKKKKQEETMLQDDMINDDISLDTDESTLLPDDEPPKKKKKLPAWVIIPIIALIGGGAFAADRVFGTSDAQNAGITVNVIEATKGSVKQTYNASGTIISGQVKTYYSPVTAPIATFNAILGNTVKSGDTLVTFDTKQLERDNQQSQLTLAQGRNASAQSRETAAKAVADADKANGQLVDQANNLADKVNEAAAKANATAANSDAAWETLQAKIQTLQTQVDAENKANEVTLDTNSKIVAQATAVMDEKKPILDAYDRDYSYTGDVAKKAYDKWKAGTLDPADTDGLGDAKRYEEWMNAKKAYDEAEQTIKTTIIPEILEVDPLQYAEDQAAYEEAQAAYQAAAAEYDALYSQWEAAYQSATGGTATADGMTATTNEGLNLSDNLAELAALTPAELVAKGKEGVKADIDGVISEVSVNSGSSLPGATGATASAAATAASQSVSPGTTVSQGGALFTISSNTNVKVSIELSPDDYTRLQTGTKATITVGKSTYNGTLTKINKIATTNSKGNSVIGAEVKIDNPDENICIGSTAKVRMTIAESDDVITIPLQAVNTSNSGEFVYLLDEQNVVKQQPIELGTSSETTVAVTSGLKEGDRIVNDMNTGLTDGVTVTPIIENDDTNTSQSDSESSTTAE